MEVIQEKIHLWGLGGMGRGEYQEELTQSPGGENKLSMSLEGKEIYSSWSLECESEVVISQSGAIIRG